MSELRSETFLNQMTRIPEYSVNKTSVRRVAAYCRVSTLQEEQEESYETQCAYYRRMIDRDPTLVLVDIYGDHGISGLSTELRPDFSV